MELLIITLVGMSFSSIIGFLMGKASKDETVIFEYPPQSELSDPKVNFPPVGFGRPHIQILEVIKANDPHEVTRKQINLALGKSKYHSYERQLWLWGYVNRREIGNLFGKGKIHFYTLTKKGKEVLSNNHKF